MVFFGFLRRVSLRQSLVVPIIGIMLGAVVSAISTFIALEADALQTLSIWFRGSFTSVYRGQYEVLWIVLAVVIALAIGANHFTAAGLGEDMATVFFFGSAGAAASRNAESFILQLLLMVGLSLVLYSWLLGSGARNMHAMLLVGIVIGGGLGSLSTFMQRLLTPSEFDVLTARLFGSIGNADSTYFPVAIPLIIGATIALYILSCRLNVLALGREAATNAGLNYRWSAIGVLVLVSILMATSTALVGPMTFLGFLVATLAYQFSQTHDHRFIFPMVFAIGFSILSSAYFILNHLFYAQGVVGIIIELVGGLTFLIVIMRKGRL